MKRPSPGMPGKTNFDEPVLNGPDSALAEWGAGVEPQQHQLMLATKANKISRRGYHLTREYPSDPLEILFVREVMRSSVAALPENVLSRAIHGRLSGRAAASGGISHGGYRKNKASGRRSCRFRKLLELISLNDLLHARVRALDAERKRERFLRIRLPGPKLKVLGARTRTIDLKY